ncbi:hypothetical protein MJN76_28485, partial [Salmonella enterica subsp. enterica serovar Anatum]|nr:hypothetical protein [Salmonella enterica subsp. enterica serovar Anatum]
PPCGELLLLHDALLLRVCDVLLLPLYASALQLHSHGGLFRPGVARERGKVNSFFMLSIAVASVLAAPMSGWIIEHLNTPDYEGWR